jgi:hypothetical protein
MCKAWCIKPGTETVSVCDPTVSAVCIPTSVPLSHALTQFAHTLRPALLAAASSHGTGGCSTLYLVCLKAKQARVGGHRHRLLWHPIVYAQLHTGHGPCICNHLRLHMHARHAHHLTCMSTQHSLHLAHLHLRPLSHDVGTHEPQVQSNPDLVTACLQGPGHTNKPGWARATATARLASGGHRV